jgi:hypothetical protein
MGRLLCIVGLHRWHYITRVPSVAERICIDCSRLQSRIEDKWFTVKGEPAPYQESNHGKDCVPRRLHREDS